MNPRVPEVFATERLDARRIDPATDEEFVVAMWSDPRVVATLGGGRDRDAIIRLVGAVLAEQTDEWAEGRRYLGLDLLNRSRLSLIEDTGNEVNTGTDTTLELSA